MSTKSTQCKWCLYYEIIIIIIILDPGTSFPGCETLSKVCGVWSGYNGDSEIVKVLDRQTALKRWIAAEIRWYRNVISRGSGVLRDALLPISIIIDVYYYDGISPNAARPPNKIEYHIKANKNIIQIVQ